MNLSIKILTVLVFYSFSVFTQSIKGKVRTDNIYSNHLKDIRTIHTYFSTKNKHKGKEIFLFCTDGQELMKMNYINSIDSLIENKIIIPINLILVESNEKYVNKDLQMRNWEYVKGYNKTMFANHLLFFTKELPLFFKKKYNIIFNDTSNLFFGCSNGAGFGLTLSAIDNSLIKDYILFSECGGDLGSIDSLNVNENKYDIYWGRNEVSPLKTSTLEKSIILIENGNEVRLKEFIGGHNNKIWKKEFLEYLVSNFPYE